METQRRIRGSLCPECNFEVDDCICGGEYGRYPTPICNHCHQQHAIDDVCYPEAE
jgi:hypothetical protein